MGSMKVHQFTRGFCWEHEPFLTLGCKRLRPLAPKLPNTKTITTPFDLKSFIRPESGPRKPVSSDDTKKDPPSPQGQVRIIIIIIIIIWFSALWWFNLFLWQLNQEASSLDWTRSASHTLSGVRNTAIYEDNFIAETSSNPQKLGGNRTDQLISARESSVAAAYYRLTNVSANKLEGSKVNQELDPDSYFNTTEKSDCVISASKEIEDIDMAINVEKGLNGKPDPDDHIINGMKQEADPEDSHHGKVVGHDVSSGITDSKTVF